MGIFYFVPNCNSGYYLINITARDATQERASHFYLRVENYPPEVKQHIPPLHAYAHRPFNYTVAINTIWYDRENDEVTINLSTQSSWLKFDKPSSTLYGLPTVVGAHFFNITYEDPCCKAKLNYTI